MTDISVIVPAFNAATALGACLDALVQQDFPAERFEIIVVDNRSTDDSIAVARQRPGVRLLQEPRRSAYAARNRGIRAARGAYIAFTDADCIARPDWLRRLHQRMMAEPVAKVIMGRDIPTGSSTAIRLLGEYDHRKEIFVLSSEDPTLYYGHTNCMMTRREVFDCVGLFDERPRGADVIFVHRVLERHGTESIQYEPGAIVHHMEVRSAGVYFKKAFIYGRSARRYGRVVTARPLSNTERLRVFRQVTRSCTMTRLEQAYLLMLLVIGVSAYGLGRCWPNGDRVVQAAVSKPGTQVQK